jgi:ubiquinone/menaquinone biosynthesis C-methylase UbiE
MTRTFLPGSVDYSGSMSRNFDVARGLSADARAVWHAALRPHLANAHRILDVGSGTGRFAVLLAEWFGAVVVGVEPAAGMRHAAATAARHPAVFYVGGRAEQLPMREASFTAVLLSNVYHHIPNRSACALELRRVLGPDGRVLIRGAFAGRLGEITLFDHFPEAKVVCEQFPSIEEAVDTFTGSGFVLESVERVVQRTCSSLEELAARTRLRADTTLALMTDEAFTARQAALEQAAAAETEPTAVVDTLDLVTMRKTAV